MGADGQESHGPVSDGHPDLDTLADADAAALDPPVTAEVLGHAATCATCTAVLDALRAVRSDLATLPRPPVPAGVAARLDAVLDVERRGRSGPAVARAADGRPDRTDPAGPAGGPVRSTAGDVLVFDPTRGHRRRRWLGWAVAAAVVVGGGGVAGAMALTGGGAGAGADDTTVAGTMAGPSPAHPPGRGHGMPIGPQHEGSEPEDTASTVPSYTRDDIEDNVAAILAGAKCDGGSCQGVSDDRPSRCVSKLGDQGVTGTPRAVQFAFFEGTPALVFVFDDDRVVVVGSDCGYSASPTILFRDH